MSWLFSLALVEASSVDICLDGEPSAPLNGANIPRAYCAPDKMTGFSRLSRFGMTFKPLTENLGEELLMSYLADFHVKTLAPLERGGGITGSRSSMWKHMARIIGEVQPRYAFVENSPMLTRRGLGTVLGDLASLGFNAEWGVLSAAEVGGLHRRERIWVLATNSNCEYVEGCSKKEVYKFPGLQGILHSGVVKNESGLRELLRPGLRREFNGLPAQVDRLTAIGNAQFPSVAATAFNLLQARLGGLK